MSSPETNTEIVAAGPPREGLSRLLDLAFGFFVWAAHFLIVYVGAALACALAPDEASGNLGFTTALALVTIAAAAMVVLHGVRRYRQQRELREQQFPMYVTIGCDAIALVGIVWQLFPIFLVLACA
jgi:membrane protein implicated in regulation of membrane protease activity